MIVRLQASKYLKIQVLLDKEEMRHLLQTLGPAFFAVVSEPVHANEGVVSPEEFLEKYGDYLQTFKAERRFFSSALSSTMEAFYSLPVGKEKILIKPIQPVVQLQAHQFFYSPLDGKFHPMVSSEESISWGIQFSYPQLYQDPKTRQVVKVGAAFPNTPLFTALMKWMRNFTMPTPFEIDGKRINSPIRVGKKSLAWIKNHPQLKVKGIAIADL